MVGGIVPAGPAAVLAVAVVNAVALHGLARVVAVPAFALVAGVVQRALSGLAVATSVAVASAGALGEFEALEPGRAPLLSAAVAVALALAAAADVVVVAAVHVHSAAAAVALAAAAAAVVVVDAAALGCAAVGMSAPASGSPVAVAVFHVVFGVVAGSSVVVLAAVVVVVALLKTVTVLAVVAAAAASRSQVANLWSLRVLGPVVEIVGTLAPGGVQVAAPWSQWVPCPAMIVEQHGRRRAPLLVGRPSQAGSASRGEGFVAFGGLVYPPLSQLYFLQVGAADSREVQIPLVGVGVGGPGQGSGCVAQLQPLLRLTSCIWQQC
ncbi:hypothetical protein CBR_g58494 [Chara braunii]|uniref:Uncharacterized protein n=1 Tax=Chara braunii TaxID=69332 RepID=A0A388MF02_CHABU|nr:hypothetical protein CBR_g58494 [Chara braunii]|eukprot:GBG93059.1 hypothetical protein CBR_g58494 [Chara braunii]